MNPDWDDMFRNPWRYFTPDAPNPYDQRRYRRSPSTVSRAQRQTTKARRKQGAKARSK